LAHIIALALLVSIISGPLIYYLYNFQNAAAYRTETCHDVDLGDYPCAFATHATIPVSWCAVNGSPAVSTHNVPSPSGGSDTSTDAILTGRLIRVSQIWNNAFITFSTPTALNIPTIPDTDTSTGANGDILDPTVNSREVDNLLHRCHAAWESLGLPERGITAANIGRFHDMNGVPSGVIGWGGCDWHPFVSLFRCSEGWSVVDDNFFMLPGTASSWYNVDSVDQLLAHEFGHALGLDHRNQNNALMNPSQQDTNGDNLIDNTGVNFPEMNSAFGIHANLQQGTVFDPPNSIVPGNFIQAGKVVTNMHGESSLPNYLDLAEAKVTLNTNASKMMFSQQILGLIPNATRNVDYWTLIDTDNSTATGADGNVLQSLHVPSTNFTGADLVLSGEVNDGNVTGHAWKIQNGTIAQISDNLIQSDISTLLANSVYRANLQGGGLVPTPQPPHPVHHTVNIILDYQTAGISIGKPFAIQAMIATKGNNSSASQLSTSPTEHDVQLTIQRPSVPICYVKDSGPVKAGADTTLILNGFIPKSSGSAFLDSSPLLSDIAIDENGSSIVQITIPSNISNSTSNHLITIIADKSSAYTSCGIDLAGSQAGPAPSEKISIIQKDILNSTLTQP
jgi:hypothetical protein